MPSEPAGTLPSFSWYTKSKALSVAVLELPQNVCVVTGGCAELLR